MNVEKIDYQVDGVVVESVSPVGVSADEASTMAQQHMMAVGALETAHIFHGDIERIVSRTTNWRKANG